MLGFVVATNCGDLRVRRCCFVTDLGKSTPLALIDAETATQQEKWKRAHQKEKGPRRAGKVPFGLSMSVSDHGVVGIVVGPES